MRIVSEEGGGMVERIERVIEHELLQSNKL